MSDKGIFHLVSAEAEPRVYVNPVPSGNKVRAARKAAGFPIPANKLPDDVTDNHTNDTGASGTVDKTEQFGKIH